VTVVRPSRQYAREQCGGQYVSQGTDHVQERRLQWTIVVDESSGTREARVRQELEVEGFGLLRREDSFYHVTDHGLVIAPNDWRVRAREMNDRGGEVGSPYPLTLGWIEHWIRGGMRRETPPL
jgi:hypothetical protein